MSGFRPDVVEVLRDLIRIPSVSPDGDPGCEETGEHDCAVYLADFLSSLGGDPVLLDVLPGRPNVFCKFPGGSGSGRKPVVLFAPHTDTVSVARMTVDPFGAEVRAGRVYGRGASDTKGSIAAILVALARCAARIPSMTHEIWFAGLMGEETGQLGAHALAACVRPDFVIAGEPTDLHVVHVHKGSLWVELRAGGVAAHGSTPECGENAILKMCAVLDVLRDFFEAELSACSHDLLGKPTWNLGLLNGGSKVNIVPDNCVGSFEVRLLPSQDSGALVSRIRAAVEAVDASIEIRTAFAAALETPAEHPLVSALAECGRGRAGAPWSCDAAIFGARGIPSVAAGPGSIAQAHTADEFIAIADLEAGVVFFSRFLESLLPEDCH